MIVAEQITSRFYNVISLFNGFIPIVAIQMDAFRVGEAISLMFTTVLGETQFGLLEDDEPEEAADRTYWEKRGSEATLVMADQLLDILRSFAAGLAFKYHKFYDGLAKDGQPNNFITFRPKKELLRFEPRLERSMKRRSCFRRQVSTSSSIVPEVAVTDSR